MPAVTKPQIVLIFVVGICVVSNNSLSAANEEEADVQELLAIDELEEVEASTPGVSGSGDAPRVLSRAQRIVVELSNDNTKRLIHDNQYVLLLGYAPWCHRSAELMPEFAVAASALREMASPLVLAKLDADRHDKAAALLGIKGFPTLLLFVNGTAHPYTGGFTGEEMVIWARKKTGVPVIRLSSVAAAKDFLKKHHTFAIGLFEKFEGQHYEEFVKAATLDNEIQFVETSNTEAAAVLFPDVGQKIHFLGLVKSEPERYEAFEDSFEESKILQFLDYNKFPLVTALTQLNSIRVHSSPIKLQVYIFAAAGDFEKQAVLLQDVARKFKSKILFIYADTADDNLAKPFLTLFGLEPKEPVVAAFDNRVGSKHLFESDLTSSKLEEFCRGLLHGTLSPYYKSEPIPNELQKGIIKAVVGRTFDSVVLNSDQNVLLEVYTPWCINCEAMSKQIEELAIHFKGQNNINFARIDASSNEHPMLPINDFPTLLFYPSGDKTHPITLSKKSSLKDLITFINSNVKTEDSEISSGQTTKDEL